MNKQTKSNHHNQYSKHSNQVRITGGEFRGRKLHFPNAEHLRPTPDMVREKLFNWLGQDLTGWKVLDLFAGSGALGFESLSRHAKQVTFCELNPIVVRYLNKSKTALSVGDRVNIIHQDGLLFLSKQTDKFDLILLDPPFEWQCWNNLFDLLQDKLSIDGWLYMEVGIIPNIPDWLEIYRQGKAGKSQFSLLRLRM